MKFKAKAEHFKLFNLKLKVKWRYDVYQFLNGLRRLEYLTKTKLLFAKYLQKLHVLFGQRILSLWGEKLKVAARVETGQEVFDTALAQALCR